MILFAISWKISANKKIWTLIAHLKKNQPKNACVMGPLSKLWMLVEEAHRSKEKQIPIDLDNIRAYIEQAVLLLDQTSNYMTYFRRYNILAALDCPGQQSNKMLFGKKFSKNLVASTKSKKQAIEIFAEKGKKKQKPFQNGPSEEPNRSSEGQHSKFFLDKIYGKLRRKIFNGNYCPAARRSNGFRGKTKNKGNLLQLNVSSFNSNRRSEECSCLGKKLVLCKKSSKLATSRKVWTFFGSVRDTYKGFRNFRNCKGFQDTFSKKSNTGESSPDATHGSGASRSNASGDRENVEEGNHTVNRASDWGVFKQYCLGWEKRWRKLTCGELFRISILKWQVCFASPNYCKREITCESWIWKMLIFQFHCISHQGIIFGFMVRESLWVPLLIFQLGTSSQNLHKIAKKNSVCPEQNKYSDSNIFGWYAYHGSNNARNSHVQRHCNLPPVTFRLCFKPRDVHFESSSGNRVPWGDKKFFEDVSVVTTRESVKNSESVSGCSCQRSGDSSQTNKIVSLLASTIQAVLPAQVNFDIFSNSK